MGKREEKPRNATEPKTINYQNLSDQCNLKNCFNIGFILQTQFQ